MSSCKMTTIKSFVIFCFKHFNLPQMKIDTFCNFCDVCTFHACINSLSFRPKFYPSNLKECQCYGWMERLAVMHVSGPGGHLALPDMVAPAME